MTGPNQSICLTHGSNFRQISILYKTLSTYGIDASIIASIIAMEG
jgi:hypothetical protein